MNRKDEESLKQAEEVKTKISEIKVSVNLSEKSRKNSRFGEVEPREKRIRKCNSNKLCSQLLEI